MEIQPEYGEFLEPGSIRGAYQTKYSKLLDGFMESDAKQARFITPDEKAAVNVRRSMYYLRKRRGYPVTICVRGCNVILVKREA